MSCGGPAEKAECREYIKLLENMEYFQQLSCITSLSPEDRAGARKIFRELEEARRNHPLTSHIEECEECASILQGIQAHYNRKN